MVKVRSFTEETCCFRFTIGVVALILILVAVVPMAIILPGKLRFTENLKSNPLGNKEDDTTDEGSSDFTFFESDDEDIWSSERHFLHANLF